VLNYLVRFGWSAGDKEIFSREELISLFGWDHVNKSDGKFDENKFADVAFEHLRQSALTSLDEYVAWVTPFLAARGLTDLPEALLRAALPGVRGRGHTLLDAARDLDFYFRPVPELDAEAKAKFLTPASAEYLNALLTLFEGVDDFRPEGLERALREWALAQGIALKEVAQPLRVAVTGRSASPPLFDVMAILGKISCLRRIARAAEQAAKSAPAG
jgi:glutamyl-tRNA synthetase